MSEKTSPQEEKYSSYELEVLAIIEDLKKFRNYLIGSKFRIVTDCSAFQRTMNKTQLTPKIARWALFLEDFNYEIVHRPVPQLMQTEVVKNIYSKGHFGINKTVNVEKRRNYNKKRKKAHNYKIGDFVVNTVWDWPQAATKIPRPYEVIKVKSKDRYVVKKVGQHESPNITSTAAEHMKMWGRIT
ncbi:hypothetical protein AVEN_15842-1 [Araneus ventricosus]|uniref:Reverse transcriptase RNase H-like domain-containing protein n=1 Tax=Araneus ventricosus TaxID=182803 RepID=A0A4Y2LVC4_ARAVE|nr:hypothetical protein AVEN_15842-1 [Araneus ventricosus]